MDMITYQEAAKILDVQYETIKHAVYNRKLTRCATGTRHALLLRQQVELFSGKHGISENYLTNEERERWEKYKTIAEKGDNKDIERSDIEEALENIKHNQKFIADKLSQMQHAHSIMSACMKEIEGIMNNTGIDIPKEMKENFPHLPLILEKA